MVDQDLGMVPHDLGMVDHEAPSPDPDPPSRDGQRGHATGDVQAIVLLNLGLVSLRHLFGRSLR